MNINLTHIVLQIIHTLILFTILTWLLWKPVTEFLEKRKQAILHSMQRADQELEKASELRRQYENQLAHAKQEAHEIIEKAKHQSEKLRQDLEDQAKQEAEKIIARAKREIEMQQAQALATLRDQIASLAVAAAGQVIQHNLDESGQEQLVEQFIEGMDRANEK